MHKFEGSDQTLGVCSSARFMPAFLNQDIITLISSRGAPDQAFLHLQVCEGVCERREGVFLCTV